MDLDKFETDELIKTYTKIQDFISFIEKAEKEMNKE